MGFRDSRVCLSASGVVWASMGSWGVAIINGEANSKCKGTWHESWDYTVVYRVPKPKP